MAVLPLASVKIQVTVWVPSSEKLNGFVFGLAAAALDETAALAVRTAVNLAVEEAVWAAPDNFKCGF